MKKSFFFLLVVSFSSLSLDMSDDAIRALLKSGSEPVHSGFIEKSKFQYSSYSSCKRAVMTSSTEMKGRILKIQEDNGLISVTAWGKSSVIKVFCDSEKKYLTYSQAEYID